MPECLVRGHCLTSFNSDYSTSSLQKLDQNLDGQEIKTKGTTSVANLADSFTHSFVAAKFD